MNKNKKHDKRNQLDIILTDLQPNEVPQIYTLKNFYNYLVTNKVMKRISRDKNEDEKSWNTYSFVYLCFNSTSAGKLSK